MELSRSTGILLHPTSLPSAGGIGDLGPAADRFLDWAQAAGFQVWQVLPLGPTTRGTCNSPYACLSAFAGNPLLISLELLVEEGSLPPDGAAAAAAGGAGAPRVDFERVVPWKTARLRASWEHFRTAGPVELRRAYAVFVDAPQQAPWLEDWGLFSALRQHFGARSWVEWDAALRRREPEALRAARTRLAGEIAYHVYLQFQFFRQWERVRSAAHRRGLQIMGDAPIYVAHDSADVWAHQRYFTLRPDGRPAAVAGVPPDYFSDTGQLWGNPLYKWRCLSRQGYRWWIERLAGNLRLVDLLRLDHFRGFVAYWRVPAPARDATGGRWVRGPGRHLFDALRAALGELPLVAEDLGVITPAVRRLKQELGLPGMKVLQFGFDDAESEHRPDRLRANDVAYTGTHDNDTTRGWFAGLDDGERRRVLDFLDGDAGEDEGGGDEGAGEDEGGGDGDRGEHIAWALLEAACAARAGLVVVPMQDALELGPEARMNTPAVSGGNWSWRVRSAELGDDLAGRLRRLAARTGRLAPSGGAPV